MEHFPRFDSYAVYLILLVFTKQFEQIATFCCRYFFFCCFKKLYIIIIMIIYLVLYQGIYSGLCDHLYAREVSQTAAANQNFLSEIAHEIQSYQALI